MGRHFRHRSPSALHCARLDRIQMTESRDLESFGEFFRINTAEGLYNRLLCKTEMFFFFLNFSLGTRYRCSNYEPERHGQREGRKKVKWQTGWPKESTKKIGKKKGLCSSTDRHNPVLELENK